MEYFVFAIIVVSIAIGLWNLMIAILGLFPCFLSTAVGTLTDAKTKKNVRTRHGHRIPIMTRYSYIYTVRGKEYRYSSENLSSKRHLFPKTSMVFVKWFPRHAYPNKFTGIVEWAMGLCFLFMGLLLSWAISSS